MHNMLQTMVSAEVVTVSDDLRYSVGPRAVAPAEQAVMNVAFGPRRQKLEAMRSADEAQNNEDSREYFERSFPFISISA